MSITVSPRLRLVPLFALAAIGVACSAVNIQQLGQRRFYESREVAQDRRTALATCRQALEVMGFTVDRGSPATGEIEMSARVQPGNTAVLLRQRRVIVASGVGPEGGSIVQVGFWEVSEDTSSAETVTATGRLLKGGGLYEVFWRRVDELVSPKQETPTTPPAAGKSGN
jgi:hypothetical protein